MISDEAAFDAVRMVDASFLSGNTIYVGGGGEKLTVDVKVEPATSDAAGRYIAHYGTG